MTEQYQHRARKRFGQNFLHDAGVIDRILRSIQCQARRPPAGNRPGPGRIDRTAC